MEKGYNTARRNNTVSSLKTSRFNDATRNYEYRGAYRSFLNRPTRATRASSEQTQAPANTEKILTFTQVGTFSWDAPADVTSIEYLVVGGGGGGGGAHDGGAGGGGGAGLVRTGTLGVTASQSYSVVVGDGGIFGSGTANNLPSETPGGTGLASSFSTITSPGGEGGYQSRAVPGGVGAGGAKATAFTGGGGGNGGGNASTPGSGGGGGGNNSAGTTSTTAGVSAAGGSGVESDITGTSVTYGAGGAGGIELQQNNGTSAPVNSGSGGQGASTGYLNGTSGGTGGSGIVVLKYSTAYASD